MNYTKQQLLWIFTRLAMGWIFLWAFTDKLFGFGFSTKPALSWLNGISPTKYYLGNIVTGPFAPFFHNLAGKGIIDIIFMAGLLGIGIALITGVFIRFASVAGIIMVSLMFLSVFPPQQNPFLDEHVIYILIFIAFILYNAGSFFSLENFMHSRKRK